jgi:hypothetical protein
LRLRDDCPLWCAVPRASATARLCNSRQTDQRLDKRPTTPNTQRLTACTCSVWADPLSLATTQGVSLISFPRGTEMFHFPRLSPPAYVFSGRYRRITSDGLPHSGIRGSKAVQRLTAAYRSRPRPSSTLGAKASTVCPYYLDGDHSTNPAVLGSVIPVVACAVFKGRWETPGRTDPSVSQNSTA